MNQYVSMFADTIFGFIALFVLIKFLGKTQITALTAFDFISAIILGELVGNALYDKNAGIPQIAFVVTLWGLLLYITEIITQKYKRTRSFLEGSPSIVIHKGSIMYDILKKNRLDINQLQHLLRSKNVFSIEEVEYAILETDGTVSVMKKSPFEVPTKSDVNATTTPVKLPRTLINDGEVVWDNLNEAELSEEWLKNELNRQNVTSIEDIFYAEWQEDQQKLFIMPYHFKKGRKDSK